MIDTSSLKSGDQVIVTFDNDETAECVFCERGVFKNVESNHHKGEIYGSSVVSFTLISDRIGKEE